MNMKRIQHREPEIELLPPGAHVGRVEVHHHHYHGRAKPEMTHEEFRRRILFGLNGIFMVLVLGVVIGLAALGAKYPAPVAYAVLGGVIVLFLWKAAQALSLGGSRICSAIVNLFVS